MQEMVAPTAFGSEADPWLVGGFIGGVKSTPRESGIPRCCYSFIMTCLRGLDVPIYRSGLPRSGSDSRLAVVSTRGLLSLELSREVSPMDC